MARQNLIRALNERKKKNERAIRPKSDCFYLRSPSHEGEGRLCRPQQEENEVDREGQEGGQRLEFGG